MTSHMTCIIVRRLSFILCRGEHLERIDHAALKRGALGAQRAGLANIDMHDLVGATGSVPMNEHPDAARQAAGDVHLVGAEQRGVKPTQLARRDGRELGVKVGRGAENRAGDVVRAQIVGLDQAGQHVASGLQDGLASVSGGSGCATDASAIDRHSGLLIHDRQGPSTVTVVQATLPVSLRLNRRGVELWLLHASECSYALPDLTQREATSLLLCWQKNNRSKR